MKASIAAELARAREATLALIEPVAEADLVRQVSPIVSPLAWDLAHVGYFEELWLVRTLGGGGSADVRFDDLYDAFRHERAERAALPLLGPAEARAYVADVRRRALEVLERVELDGDDPLLRGGYVYGMVVQHELQHRETMLQAIRLGRLPGPEPRLPRVTAEGAAAFPAGTYALGADDAPWAYDNERPAHAVSLPAFRIARGLVTNAEYGREGPPQAPVVHVDWHEADAYARSVGARLPTEAEWEVAARAGELEHAAGAVWQWTSSPFTGYPGFRAFPYREYSEVFFGDEYRVLRGGSWATDPLVARPSFRNWDYPIRRQLFSGIRLAWDA